MADKKPVIFAVDDDTQVLRALTRDLREGYSSKYRIISSDKPEESLESLRQLKLQGQDVALLLSDQRMPKMNGVEYLGEAKELYPQAQRALLTAYSDTEAAIQAINDVHLNYYLTKPWDPPEEKLFPVINDLLEAWQVSHKPSFSGIRVIGYQFSPSSHEIKDYLSSNLIDYRWYDVERSATGRQLLELCGNRTENLPVVFFEDGSQLENPSIKDIAQKLGKGIQAQAEMYDVAIIGAGPAGMAAAVYGGSEGLRTLLIEKFAPGGQAGTSSRIENYLGFPSGLSGSELADRAMKQTEKFDVEFLSPQEVENIRLQDRYKIISLGDGSEVKTKSVVITTGVSYRELPARGVKELTGAGIYYGAATTEALACKNQDVYVVGGGNSAGQAAMFLSQYARMVMICVRKEDLSSTMSDYLIKQIEQTKNIVLLPFTEIIEAKGDKALRELVLQDSRTQETRTVEAGALFIFIGAKPCTDWLDMGIIKDDKGFLKTGNELREHDGFQKSWPLERDPFLLETCVPGIFAAGDVRSGAMNRIASAVGEGAMAIKFVHQYLEEA